MNKPKHHTAAEHKLGQLLTPLQSYINSQVIASLFLLLATLFALVWASIPAISQAYTHFVNAKLGFYISDTLHVWPLYFWTNHILLTVFFFFVGLEIKRELLVGDLADTKKSISIIFIALGGMLLPAIIYFLSI